MCARLRGGARAAPGELVKLLAVDPGIRGCGAAVFDGGLLCRADYVRNPVAKGDELEAVRAMAHAVLREMSAYGCHELAAERMQVYPPGKGKGDPNRSLVPNVAIIGGIAAQLPTAVWFFPHDWKGNIPKPASGRPFEENLMYQRVMLRLSESERSSIQYAGALSHNVFDAIGIGLHALGRFKAKRVIAR